MARKIKKDRIVLFGAGGSGSDELLAALCSESALSKYKVESVPIGSALDINPREREKCYLVYVRAPYFIRVQRLLRMGVANCEEIALSDTTLYANAETVADLTVRNFVVSNSVSDILDFLKKR